MHKTGLALPKWFAVVTTLATMSLGIRAAEPTVPRVLLLYSTDRLLPANVAFDAGYRETLTTGLGERVELFTEFLDAIRFPGEEASRQTAVYLRQRYANRRPDVLVARGPESLAFFLKHRESLFPGVPIVHGAISRRDGIPFDGAPGVVGMTMDVAITPTFELMLRLLPKIREVVVITGASENDRQWEAVARQELAPYARRVGLNYWAGLTTPELLEKAASLPSDTAIFFILVMTDGNGVSTSSTRVLERVAGVSAVPVFGSFEPYVGRGVVGGQVEFFEDHGAEAAKLTLRLLAGETPEQIGSVQTRAPRWVFDERQLKRWGIAEKGLPQGSEVRYRTQSFWQLYRWHILIAAAIIASQTALIIALLVQRRRRYWAERQAERGRAELNHASRLATVGELTASIAHELNQPLGAILRNAEAADLLLHKASPDLEELKAIVTDIRADDRRAGEVIDRLRSLLKRDSVETKALDVGKLVDDVAALVRSDAITRRVKLETSVAAGLPMVKGDRVHLQQVLLNLILNGMDAVNASKEGRSVALWARMNGGGLIEIAVSDTGHGISPENMKKVFDPFFTTKAAGMGMGLSVSRTLVEAHGGRLWAENNSDRGATFRFTLPAAKEGAIS